MNRKPTRRLRAAIALVVVTLIAGCLASPAEHARRAQELRDQQLQQQMAQYKKAAAEAEQRSRADPLQADYWHAIDEHARKNFGIQDQHEQTTLTITVSWNGICAERVLVQASPLQSPPGYRVTESPRAHAMIGHAMEGRCGRATEVLIQDIGNVPHETRHAVGAAVLAQVAVQKWSPKFGPCRKV